MQKMTVVAFVCAVFMAAGVGTSASAGMFSSVSIGDHIQFRHYVLAHMLGQYFTIETSGDARESYERQIMKDGTIVVVK